MLTRSSFSQHADTGKRSVPSNKPDLTFPIIDHLTVSASTYESDDRKESHPRVHDGFDSRWSVSQNSEVENSALGSLEFPRVIEPGAESFFFCWILWRATTDDRTDGRLGREGRECLSLTPKERKGDFRKTHRTGSLLQSKERAPKLGLAWKTTKQTKKLVSRTKNFRPSCHQNCHVNLVLAGGLAVA